MGASALLSVALTLGGFPRTARADPPSPAPTPAPSPTLAPAPATPSDWVVITLLTDDTRVGLYSREPRKVALGSEVGDVWAFVCAAPCNRAVDPSLTYRVLGDGVVPSIDFNVAPGSGHLALRVSPASRSTRVLAGGLAIAGGVAATAAVLLFFIDVATRGTADALGGGAPSTQAQLVNQATIYEDVGVGLVGAGAALGVSALVLALTANTGLAPATDATTSQRPALTWIPGGFAF